VQRHPHWRHWLQHLVAAAAAALTWRAAAAHCLDSRMAHHEFLVVDVALTLEAFALRQQSLIELIQSLISTAVIYIYIYMPSQMTKSSTHYTLKMTTQLTRICDDDIIIYRISLQLRAVSTTWNYAWILSGPPSVILCNNAHSTSSYHCPSRTIRGNLYECNTDTCKQTFDVNRRATFSRTAVSRAVAL
jgi:hypothetical protein